MGTLKNCTFTIVDDEDCMGNKISFLIKELLLHATINSAENVQKVIKVLKVVKIKVLLLDLNTSEEVGLDIIGKIKKMQPEIKILMCTGNNGNIEGIRYFEKWESQNANKLSDGQEMKKLLKGMDLVDGHLSADIKERILSYLVANKKEAA